jgi:hypothetical protein
VADPAKDRWIQNQKLPKPSRSFTGTRNKASVLPVARAGELGQNIFSDLEANDWDEESEWRDAHGQMRANAMDPLPDFE